MSRPHLGILMLALGCLTACATDDGERAQLERMAAEHERCVAEFKRARAELSRNTPLPQEWDFGKNGTILVRSVDLAGRPGKRRSTRGHASRSEETATPMTRSEYLPRLNAWGPVVSKDSTPVEENG